MTATTDSEIDVQQLMMEIRAAVAKREASGNRSLIGASVELRNMLLQQPESAAQDTQFPLPILQPSEYSKPAPIRLQAEFVARKDGHYHVRDLLQYHDHTFIWNAYRAILKREPDEAGLREFLGKLRSGRLNKIDILARLRFSPEGRNRKVRVDGLKGPAFVRQLYRVPVFGYLLETIVGIVRLPVLLRSQRQFEGHSLAQQQLLADRLELLSETAFQISGSISHEMAQLADKLSGEQNALTRSLSGRMAAVSAEQRKFAALQHQQIVGLFREQREVVERLKKISPGVVVRTNGFDESSKNATADTSQVDRFLSEARNTHDELFALLIRKFRGKPEEIKEGLRFYLPFLKSIDIKDDVLDLGCGRGEWLELLKEEGVDASGVEINKVMTEEARGKGLRVVGGDVLAYLRVLPDETLNAVTGFHFIEHLSLENLIELLEQIMRTLRPGGLVIFETPNPKNLVVGACNFYSDPTHHKPIFPETLQFILSDRGFPDVRIEYLNPVADSPFVDGSQSSLALNSWFFGPRDFAVIATKPGGDSGMLKSTQRSVSAREQSTEDAPVGGKTETLKLVSHIAESGRKYHLRPETEDLSIFRYVAENNEYNLPSKFDDHDIVIDVGAHIGSFSIAVLERGAGKVYAFEAHPINHIIASSNLAQFGDRVSCRNQAVWRSDEAEQTLYNDVITGYTKTGGISVLWNESGVPVKSISLDEVIFQATDNFKQNIRLLKIDCEGAEYPILFTSKRLAMIEEICGEYHQIRPDQIPNRAMLKGERWAFDCYGLKAFLEFCGWTIELEPKSPNDGLFHARRNL